MLLNKSRGCKGKFPLRLQVCELVLAEKLATGKLNYHNYSTIFKVHLTPKYFFCLNNCLHLFGTHFAFLPLLTQILKFYRL